MKRTNLLVIALLLSSLSVFAGGLVTNTNQSAAWVRIMSRNATMDLDGVYYNPAGLAKLSNGLHLSLSNQTIMQTRTISSDYAYLTGGGQDYQAELMAPVFPSVYAAFKMDKWTFSAGFNIIGGGGSADFPTGLPSFEIPVASVVPLMQASLAPVDAATGGATSFANIDAYTMKANFAGTSTYMGYQAGATYAINDMISVAVGGRVVTVKNSYEGALTDVMINAPDYGGAYAPADYINNVVIATVGDPTGQLGMLAAGLALGTADMSLSAVQKGTGFTPILGVNINLGMLNIGAKYEHHTKLELTNSTTVDDVNMFPDGEKVRADLPGMLAVGAEVSPLKNLTATASFNYFLDKGAYYGQTDENGDQVNNEGTIDENGFSYAFGAQYKILGLVGVSLGYSSGNNGVNDSYQSDFSQALKSSTIGGGVFVDVGELLTINAGISFTSYDDYTKPESYLPTGFPAAVPYNTTYAKDAMIFAIGVDIHL